MRSRQLGSVVLGLCVSLAAGGFAGCGGSGAAGKASTASLNARLLPVSSVPGFGVQRTFDWRDPVDLVGQGIRLPEVTRPSSGVKVFKDAGMKGASGERLTQGKPPNEAVVTLGVAQFGSSRDARTVRDWMHAQDLQQPCFTACIYNPRELPIPGVPNATAVQQVPNTASPARGGQSQPTHYLLEFTVGAYLYFANTDGSPSDAGKVVGATQLYYQHVRRR